MRDKFIVAIVGIAGITSIVITCIVSGINGTIVAGGCTVIGGIVGYCFNKVKNGGK